MAPRLTPESILAWWPLVVRFVGLGGWIYEIVLGFPHTVALPFLTGMFVAPDALSAQRKARNGDS